MRRYFSLVLAVLLLLSFTAALAACTPGTPKETGDSIASGPGTENITSGPADTGETAPPATGGTVIPTGDGVMIRTAGTEISVALYRFLFAEYKASFLSALGEEDLPSFWQKDAGGITYGDYFCENLTRMLAEQCVANDRFTEKDLSLSKAAKAQVDEALSREDLSDILSAYGITEEELRLALELPHRYEAVKTALFPDKSPRMAEHYAAHYALIRLIVIRTADKDIYDGDGNVTGTAALTAEEKAEKAARIEKLKSSLSAGNFVKMMRTYSDDHYSAGYESGFFLYDGDVYTDAFLDFVFSLPEGEIGMLTEEHAVCFIERLPLPKDAYLDPYYASSFTHFYENARKDLLREELASDVARVQFGGAKINVQNTPCSPYGIMIVGENP